MYAFVRPMSGCFRRLTAGPARTSSQRDSKYGSSHVTMFKRSARSSKCTHSIYLEISASQHHRKPVSYFS